MFAVNESAADSIRRVYNEYGEFAAVIELRRHFPGVADNENARRCVRTIALDAAACSVTVEAEGPDRSVGAVISESRYRRRYNP